MRKDAKEKKGWTLDLCHLKLDQQPVGAEGRHLGAVTIVQLLREYWSGTRYSFLRSGLQLANLEGKVGKLFEILDSFSRWIYCGTR